MLQKGYGQTSRDAEKLDSEFAPSHAYLLDLKAMSSLCIGYCIESTARRALFPKWLTVTLQSCCV